MHQPGVGDLCAVEFQRFQVGEPFDVHQPGVGNLDPTQIQHLEARQVFEPPQPGIGDFRVGQPQLLKIDKTLQVHQPSVADLGVGEWSEWWVESFVIDDARLDGMVQMKLITLSPSADMFELFVPQIWPTGGDYAYPDELAQEVTNRVGNFLQNPARDALGVVDDNTYFELLEFHHSRLADIALYLAKERDPDWDMIFIETHASDYANHFFVPQADPVSGASPEVIDRCWQGLTNTYASIDRMIGRILSLADDDTLIVFASDHGGTPSQYQAVDIDKVLEETSKK